MISDIPKIIVQMRKLYLADSTPWIIGYSGGKDSTAVLQMAYYMLKDVPKSQRKKDVHVVCNDTLVETPPIVEHMTKTLESVAAAAKRDELPIITKKTVPPLKDRFFVKVIGRGYPSPTRVFRWCTDHMKIRPTNAYIKEQISKSGKAVIVLGTRRDESAQRAKTIKHYQEINGDGLLRTHGSLPGAFIYAPIQELQLEDVWTYLLQVPPPWDSTNRKLWQLYGRAGGRDCPLVLDETTQPCGNSRFGCWTCTVVRKDKSMEGLIDSGEEWMEPLLDYRDWLKEIREDMSLRESKRRNGQEAPGPFTLETRELMFRRLMEVEKEVGIELIPLEEKIEIQRLWKLDGYRGESIKAIEREQKAGRRKGLTNVR